MKEKNLNIQKVKVFILWQRKSVPNISAFMRKPKKKIQKESNRFLIATSKKKNYYS